MQIGIPWCGNCLNNSLNLFQASNKDSFSPYLNDVISFLIFAFFIRENYLAKNFSPKSFHVSIDFGSKELNQLLAQPLREYGNSLILKASSKTPWILKFLATSRNYLKWRWGSLVATHEYWPMTCIIWNIIGLNSKWSIIISGLMILVFIVFGSNTS